MVKNFFLSTLALVFRSVSLLYHFPYDCGLRKQKSLPGRVISVGNICVGGTGKSPVVMAIVKHLQERGAHPAILCRGYKSGLRRGEYALYLNGRLKAKHAKADDICADEARMQSANLPDCPVIVGADRTEAYRWYQSLSYGKSVKSEHGNDEIARSAARINFFVLDDGFSRRDIKRDLDIVLLDSRQPIGNGKFLPAGLLRESPAALKRADVLLWTRSENTPPKKDFLSNLNLKSHLVEQSVGFKTSWPEGESGRFDPQVHSPALVVCGIAKPEQFLQQLKQLGIDFNHQIILSDHEKIKDEVIKKSLVNSKALIITEKDYWRKPEAFLDLDKPVFIAHLNLIWPESDIAKIIS